jgi:Arc/MetJ-type ribon-helix-helix transcriptional regulator
MSNLVRLQVELDEERMKEIEQLMEEGKARTKKDFINAALTLLKWAMREKRLGRIIASVDEEKDTYKELEMPILSEVRPVEKDERVYLTR